MTSPARSRNGRREKKKPKLPPSDDDLWLDELHTRCGKAAARGLKGTVNIERPIKSLTLAELKNLASAIEGEWVKSVAERLQSEKPPFTDEEKEAYALLLGV